MHAFLTQAKHHVYTLSLCLLLCIPGTAKGQDSDPDQIHWAYSSFLGTGWYEIDNNREVFVLRIPPRWYFRESSFSESGGRQVGIEFHFPLTVGLHRLEQIEDFVDIENIGTISVNPGVEIEYPVTQRWRLRAYGHLGWGTELDSSDTAWMFDTGLKSRFSFQNGNLDWGLVNEVFYAGYDAKKSDSDGLGGLMAGLDFSFPISLRSGMGDALNLKFDVSYRWFENKLLFRNRTANPDSIEDEWEFGLAFAKRDGHIKIWFMNFEHMGLSYRFNSDGSFKAISVNFHSPFTR